MSGPHSALVSCLPPRGTLSLSGCVAASAQSSSPSGIACCSHLPARRHQAPPMSQWTATGRSAHCPAFAPAGCHAPSALQHRLPAEAACHRSLAACHRAAAAATSAAAQWPTAGAAALPAVRMAAPRRWALSAAAAAGSGNYQPASSAGSAVNLSGLWVKDQERSDTRGYEATLDVLGLSGLQKVTARLIEGIEIQQMASNFTVSFVTVVPFFKVTESAPLNGGSNSSGRRDLRFGWQTLRARQLPDGVVVEISWGLPMAGSLTEQYTLLPDGAMRVHAETRVGGKFAAADSIYKRSTVGRDALLAASSQRHGSVDDVINRQKQQGLTL